MKRITNRHKRNAMLPPPQSAPKEMSEADRLRAELGEWHREFFGPKVPPKIARKMVEDRRGAEAGQDAARIQSAAEKLAEAGEMLECAHEHDCAWRSGRDCDCDWPRFREALAEWDAAVGESAEGASR